MSYLLDSSSILALARKLGGRVVDLAKESFTLSLAYYEIGNALWKECSLLERLSVDEATKILGFIFSLLNVMRTIHVKDSELGLQTLAVANELNITYYDATYLTIAKQHQNILVTEDEKLAKAAQRFGVKIASSENLRSGNL